MEFNSLFFIFLFLPAILLLNFFIKERWKNIFLLAISLFFYYFGEGNYLFVLLFSIIFNYYAGSLIEKKRGSSTGKALLLSGIGFNILLLIYYKYSFFILRNLESVFGTTLNGEGFLPEAGLPVGISFYTFVAISYLVDIYRGSAPCYKSGVDFALYFSLFPKIATGPITFHHKFRDQVLKKGGIKDNFEPGIKRFVYGLGKKVLLADPIAVLVNRIFEIPAESLGFSLAWIGVIAFTLQIYLDFSGYTDMAVGIGHMLGFNIPENFNYPYVSRSIKDFWKRWHITLSKWLQFYIFLPIAYGVMRKVRGDRFMKIRVENLAYFIASFLTMALCGLWHGAEWTFVLWGLFHGIILIIEHLFLGKFLKRNLPKSFRILYAQVMIIFGWAIFRSADLSQAKGFIKAMTGFGGDNVAGYYPGLFLNPEILFILSIGIFISFPVIPWLKNKLSGFKPLADGPVFLRSLGYAVGFLELLFFTGIFVLGIMAIIGGAYAPFIYFRF